jgi:hypothetical protein
MKNSVGRHFAKARLDNKESLIPRYTFETDKRLGVVTCCWHQADKWVAFYRNMKSTLMILSLPRVVMRLRLLISWTLMCSCQTPTPHQGTLKLDHAGVTIVIRWSQTLMTQPWSSTKSNLLDIPMTRSTTRGATYCCHNTAKLGLFYRSLSHARLHGWPGRRLRQSCFTYIILRHTETVTALVHVQKANRWTFLWPGLLTKTDQALKQSCSGDKQQSTTSGHKQP